MVMPLMPNEISSTHHLSSKTHAQSWPSNRPWMKRWERGCLFQWILMSMFFF